MKYNRYKVFGFALVSMVAFSACSDSFLDDKKNYDNVNPDVYNYYEGTMYTAGVCQTPAVQ